MGKKSFFLKVLVGILCAAVVFLFPLSAFAASDGMYEYEVVNGSAIITAYLGAGNAVVTLPTSLGGYPVTGIGEYAFGEADDGKKEHAEVQQIVFHSGITYIGDRAFAGTSWIDSPASGDSDGFIIVNGILVNYVGSDAVVRVPDSVRHVNIAAFEKRDFITEVTLPASVTQIAEYTFYKCTALRQVTALGALTEIGQSAFYGCQSLQTVATADGADFPQTLVRIGDNAFYNCSSLSGVLDLGTDLDSIGTYAFANCPLLQGLRVPDTLSQIGSYPFGFALQYRDNSYYPIQQEDFTIYVSHEQAATPQEEQEVLQSYSKTGRRIYQYATNPDGSGYFDAFKLVWDRLAYEFCYGDVNNDGRVTSADAREVLRHAVSLSFIENESDRTAADMNRDGYIRTNDARSILRTAVGLDS